MGASQVVADRIDQADGLSLGTIAKVCNECEGICYEVMVWAHGHAADRDYRSCLFVRDHLPKPAVLTVVGRWMMAHGNILQDRENARWILEHQGSLW